MAMPHVYPEWKPPAKIRHGEFVIDLHPDGSVSVTANPRTDRTPGAAASYITSSADGVCHTITRNP